MTPTTPFSNRPISQSTNGVVNQVFSPSEKIFTSKKILAITLISFAIIGLAAYLLKPTTQPTTQPTITTSLRVKEFTGNHSVINTILESWNKIAAEKYHAVHKKFYLENNYPDDYESKPPFTRLYSRDMSGPAYYYLGPERGFHPAAQTADAFNSDIGSQFPDVRFIISFIKREISDGHTIIISESDKGIEAIALYSKGSHELKHIVTHPKNVKNDINAESRVTGAGTSIILFLAQQAAQESHDLTLESCYCSYKIL
jgi:hypothetical protein